MHVHTAASDDSTATIEGYIELILAYRRLGHRFDGFVLTEHRKFTPGLNLQHYWDDHGILVLQGVEMDTSQGHLLVFGVNDRLLQTVDVTQRLHNGRQIIPELTRLGAVAAPSHPFRESILGPIMQKDITEIAGLQIIEAYNGQNTRGQNEQAAARAAAHDLRALGGSDAHYLSPKWFLTCGTEFDDDITSESDLIEALHYGNYAPIVLPEMDEADAPTPKPVLPKFF
jgi:predicted metal-dependent phosphoesterase TrpH